MPNAAKVFQLHPKTPHRKETRPPSSQRGYGAKWRKARADYLSEHRRCVLCAREGRSTLADTVDHIIPHKGDMKLFWDRKNWQACCQSCHSRKTAKQDGGFGHG